MVDPAVSNRTTINYPSGLTAQYGFDLANHLTSVNAGSFTIVSSATYLPFGPLTRMTFGNGTVRTVAYDNRYRVTYNRDFAYDDLNRLTTANSGASLWGHGSYTYDAMGNMLTLDLGEYVEVNPVHVTRCKFCLRPTANDVPATASRGWGGTPRPIRFN